MAVDSLRETYAIFVLTILWRPLVSVVRRMQWGANMPRKIRELIRDLERAGFIDRGGKGSHRNFEHSCGARITLSGKPGDDAKSYQEREVKRVIEESQP